MGFFFLPLVEMKLVCVRKIDFFGVFFYNGYDFWYRLAWHLHVQLLWRPVLVKIMTIKLHYKSISVPLQQIIWTCCIFLSSLNNTFFSVLVIIFSNMSYFSFNHTNTFFIHTLTYFSVELRIIFLMCIENYFFIGPRIIFRGIAKLFLSP